MAGIDYTSRSVPISNKMLNGGLNTSSGPLGLTDAESPSLANIDFDRFGSILKRNGYEPVNPSWQSSHSGVCYGLHWYEANIGGTLKRYAIAMIETKSNTACAFMKMDSLDGAWDDVSGNQTYTTNYFDFTNFLQEVYVTAENTPPSKWTGGGNCVACTTVANLHWAKYNEEFNNHLFIANVRVGDSYHNARVYWSELKNTDSWTATNFIDIGKDDGQAITRIKKLGDRLVIYKDRSIYNLFYTGDPDVPFILPGGGKSNSHVGCAAPFSVQEVDNGHVFLSYDGFYFYDGLNSYKISDKITNTLIGFNRTYFKNAASLVQKDKSKYWCAFTLSGDTTNSRVLVWDYYNNAFSLYTGLCPSAMATFYVNGVSERPYFGDYNSYVYRADYGDDDYPLNTQTAITAYYNTNWKTYDDLINKKAVLHTSIYHQIDTCTLTFSYAYDFETTHTYSQTLDLSTSTDVYGSAAYDEATYAASGGRVERQDITGRGRSVQFGFSNAVLGESFQIDGFGMLAHVETVA